jgi:hypothetical protein
VWSVDRPARLETYAITGTTKGCCELNGGAALHFAVGERLVVASFCQTDSPYGFSPKIVKCDEDNKIVDRLIVHNTIEYNKEDEEADHGRNATATPRSTGPISIRNINQDTPWRCGEG